MKTQVLLNAVYAVSADVMVRKVEDEIILIPLLTCEADTGNEPFILNMMGQTILRKLDGEKRLTEIVANLAVEFNCSAGVIEKDVIAFVKKLLKRKLLVDVA